MVEKENCQKGVLELLSASENNDDGHVNSLLNEDISLINAQDSDGYTSLHRASYNNHYNIAKILLSRGADTDMKTLDGWQPLHSACKWNSLACAQILIENGADVNARTNGGQTPLHIAASNPDARETLKLLLSLPYIEIDVHNSCKETPYQIALRSGKNADLFESLVYKAIMSAKKYTLVLIRNSSGEILLGLKKRGFGSGKWNGFGGKLEDGETLEEAAVREVKEECNLIIDKSNLKKVAVLTFEFVELEQKLMEVHVFTTSNFSGEIRESDEMMPAWFPIEEIPFDNMFADDKMWFPLFLKGKQFTGNFVFKNIDVMLSHKIDIITF